MSKSWKAYKHAGGLVLGKKEKSSEVIVLTDKNLCWNCEEFVTLWIISAFVIAVPLMFLHTAAVKN